MWEYRAHVEKVVDGDSPDVTLDLGVDTESRVILRLAGMNAAEHDTPRASPPKAYGARHQVGQSGEYHGVRGHAPAADSGLSEALVTNPSTAPNSVGRSHPPETSRCR